MSRIGIRELRQHASRYIERVKAGETVEVTDRGRLVALLVPPNPGLRDRLVAAGQLVPGRGDPLRHEPLPSRGQEASGALARMRADER